MKGFRVGPHEAGDPKTIVHRQVSAMPALVFEDLPESGTLQSLSRFAPVIEAA
jgi:hypothetical protein